MSEAREIYALIQKMRDKMTKHWRDWSIEQYPFKCECDKTCEAIQQKIVEVFSEKVKQKRKEPDSD